MAKLDRDKDWHALVNRNDRRRRKERKRHLSDYVCRMDYAHKRDTNPRSHDVDGAPIF